MDLVPLKVKIGLKNVGGKRMHGFPDFNKIDASLRDNLDWSYFVDKFGGWHYDQVCGHADDDPDSPVGNWNGMLLVPTDFAEAAIVMFSEQCSIMPEVDAEVFYNDRAHVRDPIIREDVNVLQSIKAKRDLGIEEDQTDRDALNPDHPASGRRRNTRKTWGNYKIANGIVIV